MSESNCTIMELHCLERARFEPRNRGKWIAQAERWHELGRAGYLPSRVRQLVVDSPRCLYARRYAVVPVPGDPVLPR